MRPKVWSRRNGIGPAGMRMLCAAALSVLALCRPSAASEPTIAVEGNRRTDAQAIREHFHASSDALLMPAAVDAALKELYETGLFEDVKIARSGTHLIVTVVEAPLIERLRFEGNKQIKDEDLAKEISLKPRGAMTKAAVREDVARIIEIYHRNGRYQVEVTPNTIGRGEGRVDLVFEIREGAKTGVKGIAFVGNREFAESRLQGVIKTTESGWFGFLKTSDVYDPDRIEADADLLRQSGLRNAVHLVQGNIFDGEAVGKAVDAIAVAAGKRGFPFVDVRPHANRDSAANVINVVFTLDDGPRRYVERINIHGNTFTRDEAIRREFDVAEGDAYNRGLIDAAERRLKQLAPFKSVKITAEDGSTPDRVVLNVEVEEQQTGDLSFSGGYSTSVGIIGEVSVSERNFLGRGQYVKVSVAVGEYLHSGAVSFVEPYFLGNRMSLGLDLFFKETLANPTQSYGSESYGAGVKVSAPLMDGVTSEAHYALVNQSVSLSPTLMECIPPNASTTCPSVAVKQAALNGAQWVSTVGSTLTFSSLDNPKSPHDGVRAELRQDVASLPGTVDFLRTTADMRYYRDLGNDVVGLMRAQGGYITPYGGQTLPLTSSFFGGPQLVRGFAVNGFGPRDITSGTTQDNIGGSRYWTTSAELQAAIPRMPPEIALKAAVFADAGSLWGYRGATSFPSLSQSLTVADSQRVRSSIGSSLIWDSPFGALRVDYAYPISKASTDVTQRLHFGVGAF